MKIEGPLKVREDLNMTTRIVLKNGLTLLMREQHAVPLVAIVTHVKAGYFDEDDRVSGISHVIEHMFFKGTAKRATGEIARETKGLGGYLNAYTYYDRTVYHTVVPSENAVGALEIQADALWRSAFDAAELKKEVEVVIQENNRKLDNPASVTTEKLFSIAFTKHRMGRWRIGTPDGLRALTRDDVVSYYSRYYRPSNIVLSIVGDFEREAMIENVVRLYGEAVDEPVQANPSPSEPAQTGIRYSWQRGPVEMTYVAAGFHAPGAASPEAATLHVIAAMLSDGRASSFLRFVRDEKALITTASASYYDFRDFGYFEFDFSSRDSAIAAVAVLAEVEGIRRKPPSAEALVRAKAMIAQRYWSGLETVDGVAGELAYREAMGDWRGIDTWIERVLAVTAEDVARVAQTVFDPAAVSVYEFLPEAVTRNWSAEEYAAAVLSKTSAQVEDRTAADEVVAEAPVLRTPEAVEHDFVKPVRKFSILRGHEVYVVEDRRLPLVSVGVFFPGGRLYESAKNAGVTELMLRSALRGSRRYGSSELSRRLEAAGARIQIVNEPDFFGYILEAVSGRVEESAQLLIELLQSPAFLEDDVEKEKQLQLARIQKLKENNTAYPVHLLMRSFFPEHAYGRSSNGTAEAVKALGRNDVESWFRQNQRPLSPVILIVGDTQGTELVAPLTDALTNDDLHARDIGTLPSPRIDETPKTVVEELPRQQTALVVGYRGVNSGSSDRYALIVLENIVSGLGGRFFDAIREKQGLAYTVATSNASFAKGGVVFTYTAFSPQNEDKVRQALLEEIEKLRKDGVTASEVKKSIDYSIGSQLIRMQTRTGQSLEYARAVFSGVGISAVSNFTDMIRRVTPELVKTMASLYLDPKGMHTAVVRGKK